MPPVPKVGVGSDSGKNSRSMRAADRVDEEAEAEDAEDDRRHAGQVVDRDAHHAHQRPLLGVLAQVERGEHAERRHREGHQEHHHHRAEDGREDAALGVRLARVVGDELAQPRQVEAELAEGPRGVGLEDPHDVGDRELLGLAGRGPHHQGAGLHLLAQRKEALGELLVLGLLLRDPALQLALPTRPLAGGQVGEGQAALVEPQVLDLVVDVADLALLELPHLVQLLELLLVQRLEGFPDRVRPAGQYPLALVAARPCSRRSCPTPAARAAWLRGQRTRGDLSFVDPDEVEAVEVAVADLQAVAVARPRTSVAATAVICSCSQTSPSSLRAVLQGQLHEVALPEEPQAVEARRPRIARTSSRLNARAPPQSQVRA